MGSITSILAKVLPKMLPELSRGVDDRNEAKVCYMRAQILKLAGTRQEGGERYNFL
jgi:hypothetical protein